MKSKKIKVGDTVTVKNPLIDGTFMGIPMVFIDEDNSTVRGKETKATVTKVKYGRKKNKGTTTLTISPNKP